MPEQTVERKILFFVMTALPRTDGTFPSLDISEAFSSIQRLRFLRNSVGPTSRYCDDDGSLHCSWPTLAGNRIRLELGRVRRSDLPSLDTGGTRGPLPIEDDQGLLEISHMQFFPEGIVGAEFNFHGPRANAFSRYVDIKVPTFPKFRLRPLLRRDFLAQLDELTDIRLLDIRVHRSAAESLQSINQGLPAVFRAAENQYDAETFEIVIRPKRGRKLDGIREVLRGIFGRQGEASQLVNDFQTLKVRGKMSTTDRVENVDFLRDQFIQSTHIAKLSGKTRAIDSSHMYAEIEDAYNTRAEELRLAASAEIEAWQAEV